MPFEISESARRIISLLDNHSILWKSSPVFVSELRRSHVYTQSFHWRTPPYAIGTGSLSPAAQRGRRNERTWLDDPEGTGGRAGLRHPVRRRLLSAFASLYFQRDARPGRA